MGEEKVGLKLGVVVGFEVVGGCEGNSVGARVGAHV